MKHILFISFMFLLSAHVAGQVNKEASDENFASIREELDKAIEDKHLPREKRKATADSLRAVAAKSHGTQRVDTYKALFKLYSRVQTDSALLHLDHLAALPEATDNRELQTYIKVGRAETFAVMGLYSNAVKLLDDLFVDSLPTAERLYYYHVCRSTYGWMADYAAVPEVSAALQRMTQAYRDSIIMLEPKGINRNIVIADKLLTEGRAKESLQLSLSDLPDADEDQQVYICSNIAEAYEQMGNEEKRMYYLARTAIGDMQRGVTEYMALPILAQLLYEQGDTERSYSYLSCSMEDANYCKARLRCVEAGNIFPIIDKAYKNHIRQQRRLEHISIYTLCLFILLLTGGIFYLRKQMKKLAQTRKQLARANGQLKQVNHSLLQTDKVKEKYITLYLGRCRSYLDTLDNYRKNLLKLAKARQTTELLDTLKSDTTISKEQEKFYADFDEAFLNIYPNFVERFNALLRPEDRIEIKEGKNKLTTELRIFALIRLGVSDTTKIAHFLNYSLATIYNYRSRIRNSSIYSKEEFEKKLMEI